MLGIFFIYLIRISYLILNVPYTFLSEIFQFSVPVFSYFAYLAYLPFAHMSIYIYVCIYCVYAAYVVKREISFTLRFIKDE